MYHSISVICVIACLIGFAPAEALASESCKEVRLDAGRAILAGKTKDNETEFTCFQLLVKQGLTLRLKMIYAASPDMAFNIADVIDNQDKYTFLAKKNSYRIDVYNTFRRSRTGPFKILVTVVNSSSDTQKTLRPQSGTSWTANANDEKTVVNAHSLSTGTPFYM